MNIVIILYQLTAKYGLIIQDGPPNLMKRRRRVGYSQSRIDYLL
jgi:hypothetical protein